MNTAITYYERVHRKLSKLTNIRLPRSVTVSHSQRHNSVTEHKTADDEEGGNVQHTLYNPVFLKLWSADNRRPAGGLGRKSTVKILSDTERMKNTHHVCL
jgi:hypothetical protein